jgi:hypothetical protein
MTKPRIIRGGDESESDLSEMFAALELIASSWSARIFIKEMDFCMDFCIHNLPIGGYIETKITSYAGAASTK